MQCNLFVFVRTQIWHDRNMMLTRQKHDEQNTGKNTHAGRLGPVKIEGREKQQTRMKGCNNPNKQTHDVMTRPAREREREVSRKAFVSKTVLLPIFNTIS